MLRVRLQFKVPTSCKNCPLSYDNKDDKTICAPMKFECDKYISNRAPSCPLIEIPVMPYETQYDFVEGGYTIWVKE